MINDLSAGDQAEVYTLLFFIKETIQTHVTFLKNSTNHLKEDVILSEAKGSIVELEKIAFLL